MNQSETIFQMLYVSRLAPGCDFGIVKEIVTVSRQRNPARGITGALLFDGEHFGQLLEGPEQMVRSLVDRIGRDARHTDMRVLLAAPSGSTRLLQQWRSGYCDACQLEAFNGEAALRDRPALDAFRSVLSGADME